ncbi:carbon-nitrogen hydrolase family protein [Lysinibacter sp. HNR]|uniref:carbon-nitrogen hydrolase family protein n=1 Tax=Lysinibacter sp. HNR TaxID=3031408 RepID=UPI002435869C|nr:carbon-nitrogen hydrolase family protein [Lysinibacter sp. HNR]WGD38308.1 carbon-nitrogen hydrolase family protein [Lysinibacter sp. HNR]
MNSAKLSQMRCDLLPVDVITTVPVAAVQFSPGPELADNLTKIISLTERAAEEGAKLVLFPEYSLHFTPRMSRETVTRAESVAGPSVTALRNTAHRLDIYMVFGFIESIPGESNRGYNTVLAINPRGEIVASYRKVHLYDAFGQRESEWILPGDIAEPPVFWIEDLGVGLQTCYDLRFPESTRWLVDGGAELVLVPAEWVAGDFKTHHWKTLLAARAIENTVYIAAANHTPPIAVGNTSIIDPRGQTLATIEYSEGAIRAEISRETLNSVRKINPALALRRFSVQSAEFDK